MFELLPQLTYLDGFDQEDNEVPDSEADADGETQRVDRCNAVLVLPVAVHVVVNTPGFLTGGPDCCLSSAHV